jgi:hypothetical protein
LVARLGLAVQRAIGVTVEPVLAETTVPAMVAAMEGATPVVGLSERWQSEGLGRFRRQLVMARPGSLVVRRGVRPGLLAHPVYESRFAWSMVVDPAP